MDEITNNLFDDLLAEKAYLMYNLDIIKRSYSKKPAEKPEAISCKVCGDSATSIYKYLNEAYCYTHRYNSNSRCPKCEALSVGEDGGCSRCGK